MVLGKQAIDDDANQTGQMLGCAARLGPGDVCLKVEVAGDTATVTRAKSTVVSKPSP